MSKFLCVVIFLSTIVFSGHCESSNKKCVQENPCLCRLNEFSKIDISSVLNNKTYLEDTHGNITYYFLGCEDHKIPLNTSLTGSLMKRVTYYNNVTNTTSTNYTLSKASSLKFEYDDKFEEFQLVYNETNVTTIPTIRLFCEKFNIPLLKIINVETDELSLSSPKVCVITEHRGLSGGTIFLIILFVSAGIYFFGGALILYFLRGARDIEMIPNIDFWRNLPGLVKDGAIFLLSGCKPTFVSTAETYDRI